MTTKKPVIFITGSHGFLGSALVPKLKEKGYDVRPILRGDTPTGDTPIWHVNHGLFNSELLSGAEAVIHLGGMNIAEKRWSSSQKQALLENRTHSAELFRESCRLLKNPPKTLIIASAIGFYGHRPQEDCTESSLEGLGFAPELCCNIEQQQKQVPNVRTVYPRIGIVCAPHGGALKKMLPAFKLGLGGQIGNGQQLMSWISLEDAVNALIFCLENQDITGAVNLTAPTPVTNKNFSKYLAKALKRPAFLPLPEKIVCFLFGQMGEELLLASTKALPQKLLDKNFTFKHPHLEPFFKEIFLSNK